MRQTTVGGDNLHGSVFGRHGKSAPPVKFAKIRVYSSLGKIVYGGVTDENGEFGTGVLPPDDYRLVVEDWGSVTVKLDPKADEKFGDQRPTWTLRLTEHNCVWYIANSN